MRYFVASSFGIMLSSFLLVAWISVSFLFVAEFRCMDVLFCCYCHRLVPTSCPTLCDSMDGSLPGSSIHGISQARMIEWVAISFSRESSWSRDQYMIWRFFLPFFCPLTLLIVSFEANIFQIWWNPICLIFSLVGCALGAISKKPVPNSWSWTFISIFF